MHAKNAAIICLDVTKRQVLKQVFEILQLQITSKRVLKTKNKELCF